MSKQTKLPAMVLQELTVKRNFAPPEYNITRQVSGSHQNFFEYTVTVSGIQATGSGASKQISKHKAAYNALMQLKDLKIYDPEEIPVEEFDASINKNCDIDLGPLTYICKTLSLWGNTLCKCPICFSNPFRSVLRKQDPIASIYGNLGRGAGTQQTIHVRMHGGLN